jgi:hypothetical protein
MWGTISGDAEEMGTLELSTVSVTLSSPLLVVSLSGEIGEVGASAPDSKTLFAKELCDLPILTAKDSRGIIKKVKKSLKSKCKKSDMARKASAAA